MLIGNMANKKTSKQAQESDGAYLLKLVLYVVMGSQWLWIVQKDGSQIPLPLGLALGLLFASKEQFQIDRKIEIAVLLVASIVAFWGQVGIFVTL